MDAPSRASGRDDPESPSRLISVNDLSMVVSGKKELSDLIEGLDLAAEVDRPALARVRCSLPDPARFDVRELLGALRAHQSRNFDWHLLALMESTPDASVPGERVLYETSLRDFRDMAECSAVTFGRNSANDWILPNALISRRHGMVVIDDALKIWVIDGRAADGSTNGLFYMDRAPQVIGMQQLTSPAEMISFGPEIRYHDGSGGLLFRIRVERVQ